jgi:hypothetical protein
MQDNFSKNKGTMESNFFSLLDFYVASTQYRSNDAFQALLVEEDLRCIILGTNRHWSKATNVPEDSLIDH